MKTIDYLATAEATNRQELRWGTVVREPAAPFWPHHRVATGDERIESAVFPKLSLTVTALLL